MEMETPWTWLSQDITAFPHIDGRVGGIERGKTFDKSISKN